MMKRINLRIEMGVVAAVLVSGILFGAHAKPAMAQQAAIAAMNTGVVPGLVPFAGELTASAGQRVAVNFAVYAAPSGGSALWSESQNVTVGKDGKYAVLLGAGSSAGMPQGVFATGEARWLGIRVGDGEEARTELASVPYAMKAADAESLAGRAASEFVTQDQLAAQLNANLSRTAKTVVRPDTTTATSPTGSGTAKYLPVWTAASTLGNSILYQSGTSTNPFVGINTTSPNTLLDVNGEMTVRNELMLTSAAATASAAVNSPAMEWVSNAWNSSTVASVAQKFAWRITASGNNTTAPTGNLQLLTGIGTATPAATGLSISPKGIITFATGQTFPGTGSSGGTGSGTTIKAGFGLASSTSGTTQTLAVDTTKIASLAAANTFTGTDAFNSSVTIGGASNAVARLVVTGAATSNGTAMIGFGGVGEGAYGVVGYGSQGTSSYDDGGNGAYFDGGAGTSYGGSGAYMQGGTGKYPGAGAVLYGANDSVATYGGDGADLFGGSSNTAYGGTGAQIFGGGSQNGTGGMGAFIEGGSSNSSAGGDGIEAAAGQGTSGTVYAGYFAGNVKVTGTLSAGAKNFQIDHPLDPANKYLNHTSIESSEMVNIYSGNVTTDESGVATVQLPDWFETVNGDFRYQLTVLGQFAQAIVSQKIANHQFRIRTNAANVEVSWQVTGVRHDAFAKANPLVVEQAKPANERGFYANPELYGQPATKQTAWGRHPQVMQAMANRKTAPQVGIRQPVK
jgi:trimeric autotransporter adhesin